MAPMTDEEAAKKTHLELYDELLTRFEDLDTKGKGSLANAAEFVAAGTLPWSRVEQALDEGWDPYSERIVEHLFAGVGVEMVGDKHLREEDDQWVTTLECTECGTTWERTLDDLTEDWLEPETWTCPEGCNAGETL